MDKKIVVTKNGPYRVTGKIDLRIMNIIPNSAGQSWEWNNGNEFEIQNQYNLCRCGQSQSMPFCDNTHLQIDFYGQETAGNIPFDDQAKNYSGPTLLLKDAISFCAFARFCDPAGQVWNLVGESDNPDARALAIREANYCPAGRLVMREKENDEEIEMQLEPSIGVVEDLALGCSGPLWIRGGIPVESANGEVYEKRNRVTLCRCGKSSNKPFCNGSHATVMFNDGLME